MSSIGTTFPQGHVVQPELVNVPYDPDENTQVEIVVTAAPIN